MSSTAEKIERYRAWMERITVERPMIGLLWEPDIPPLPEFVDQIGCRQIVSPQQIRPQMFLSAVERWYQQDTMLISDVIQPFTPAFGIPWTEAIAGCPVAVYPGSLWAEPALLDYADRAPIEFDPTNPWLQKMVEFTRVLVRFSDGRFPVALPQMRGPLDMLAALRTPQQMSLDMLERPEAVFKILEELTELWIRVADTVLAAIPPYHGGYCTRMKMWAPGKAITPQNDVSTLISPSMYREFALPWDNRIVGHFPYSSFHMHASEHHQIPNLLELEGLTAIEVTLEHTLGGPALEKMLPLVREILAHKPLLLCALDVDTAERCIRELPAAGLCVLIGVSGEYDNTRDYARWLDQRFPS